MYYTFHLLLQSRYKFLINLIIYLLIIYIYNSSIDNYDIVECMKRPKSANTSDINKVTQLTLDNIELKTQLDSFKLQCNIEKEQYNVLIKQLEDNQEYLIGENRTLRNQLEDATQSLTKTTSENLALRTEVVVQKQINDSLRRELEIAQQGFDKYINDLLND